METEITTIYVICDDYLKTRNYCDDSQVSLTTAEVMTTALAAVVKPMRQNRIKVF